VEDSTAERALERSVDEIPAMIRQIQQPGRLAALERVEQRRSPAQVGAGSHP
jgi:hypothetical protein